MVSFQSPLPELESDETLVSEARASKFDRLSQDNLENVTTMRHEGLA